MALAILVAALLLSGHSVHAIMECLRTIQPVTVFVLSWDGLMVISAFLYALKK